MNTRLAVTPSAKHPFTVTARVVGYDNQATLHWGDGSAPTHTAPNRTYEHHYPAIGRYMVTAVDGSGVLIGRQQISVTGSLALDEVRVADDDAGIRVSFGEIDPRLGVSYYRVEWQDADIEHVWGVPGRAVRHDSMPGIHDIKIIDTSSGRTQKFTVNVTDGPRYDPDFTVHHASEDEHGMTVYLRLRRVESGRSIHIWWDDADGPQLVAHPVVGMEIPHMYTFPGHYMQTVAYAGSTQFSHAKSEAITVPDNDPRGERLDRQQNTTSAIEGSYPSFAWAHRLSRLGPGDNSVWRGLFTDRSRVSRPSLELENTGVREPGVDDTHTDADAAYLALAPARDAETTGRIETPDNHNRS